MPTRKPISKAVPGHIPGPPQPPTEHKSPLVFSLILTNSSVSIRYPNNDNDEHTISLNRYKQFSLSLKNKSKGFEQTLNHIQLHGLRHAKSMIYPLMIVWITELLSQANIKLET
ncbi:MAG: hypothetical protein P8L49_11740 [Opitutaceae bacterium]|nr:hypothetical protein [Opitutaceae bacterium]